jgi:hypothetical protein
MKPTPLFTRFVTDSKRQTASISAVCTLFFVFLVLVGCAVQGPAGPAGPQGPPGPQGPSGPSGASARVVNITVAANQWATSGVGSPGALLQSGWFTAPNITADVINSGVVLTFMQMETNPSTWQQLPITFYGTNVFQVFDAQYRVNQVQIFINQSSTAAPARPTGSIVYRIVAISGTTTAQLKQTVDISSYAAVKQAFHLAE